MATVHGEESNWLRTLVTRRAAALALYGVVLSSLVVAAATWDPRAAVILFACGIALAGRRRGLAQRYRHASEGAAGELATAKLLALLPAGFTVVNDLSFPGFNVDHVVVGATGIWAIETKSHTGNVEERAEGVWLDGRPMFRDPRRQARGGAAEVAALLERVTGTRYWVEALVCFPNATVVANEEEGVVGMRQLLARLRLARPRLQPAERDRIVDALERAKSRVEANRVRTA